MTPSSDGRDRADPDDVSADDAIWLADLLNRAVFDEEPSSDLAERAHRRVDAPNGRAGQVALVAAVAAFVLLVGGFAVMRPNRSSDLGPLATGSPTSDVGPPGSSTPSSYPDSPGTSTATVLAPPVLADPVPPSMRDSQVAPFVGEPAVAGTFELVSFTRNGDAFDVVLRWGAVEGTRYEVLASAGLTTELASTELVASATGPVQVVLRISIGGLTQVPPDDTVRYQVYTPAENGGVLPQSGPRIWVPDTTGLSTGDAVDLMRITSQLTTIEASGSCAQGTVCSSTPAPGSTASASENLADPPVTLVTGR